MEKYSRYKFSGEQWLGDIPEHWETRKAKYLFELITTPSDSSNKIGLENIESATGRFVKTENEFEGNGIAFQPNDIVYGKLRPYLQKVWLADFAGNAVGDVYVLRCNENIQPTFVKYVMLSYNFTVAADSSTYGAKMPRVSYEFIGNLKWGLPPLSEQRGIVSYLDRVTGGIDKAISHSERMIELLRERKQIIIQQAVTKGLNPNAKLKHSGVEWIGDIPEHWEMRKLKYLGLSQKQVIDPRSFPHTTFHEYSMPAFDNAQTPNVTSGNSMDSSKLLIEGPTLLINKLNVHKRRIWYIESPKPNSVASTEFVPIKLFGIEPEFIKDFLSSDSVTNFLVLSSKGATNSQKRVAPSDILNLMIPIPTKDEQRELVDYINAESKPISEAIASEERKIELLRERKQIIINEAVTGKIKVI